MEVTHEIADGSPCGKCLPSRRPIPFLRRPGADSHEFFNNRQMTMVIGTTVGGGYDIFGRMFAAMGKYLPGGNAQFTMTCPAQAVWLQPITCSM